MISKRVSWLEIGPDKEEVKDIRVFNLESGVKKDLIHFSDKSSSSDEGNGAKGKEE